MELRADSFLICFSRFIGMFVCVFLGSSPLSSLQNEAASRI